MSRSNQPLAELLTNTSDEVLLIRYRDAGDISAFEKLVHRYERPLFSYLPRYLRSAPLAEEVFQATLFHVHEKNDKRNDKRGQNYL